MKTSWNFDVFVLFLSFGGRGVGEAKLGRAGVPPPGKKSFFAKSFRVGEVLIQECWT